MQNNPPPSPAILNITALWAFAECALGGIMHAFKLPFTGFFVGGFAVLCIGLLAHLSGNNAAIILRSTLLVILVKALVSPYSPPTAYLAVGFQGVSGALLLGYVRPHALAAYLFGLLALLESALQKILVLLLFFGKPLFDSIDLFFKDVLKNFGLQNTVSGSSIAVGAYIGLYCIWGLVLGYCILKLPARLDEKTVEYTSVPIVPVEAVDDPSKRKKNRWLFPVLVLAFIVATFLLAGGKGTGGQKALYAVLRTAAVLTGWFFIVLPLVRSLFHRWAKKRSAVEQSSLQQILEVLPDLRIKARVLYRYVSGKYRGWKRVREFAIAMFVVALHRTSA